MGLFHGTGVYFSAVSRRWNYAIYEHGRLRKIIIEDTRYPPPLYWEFLKNEEWTSTSKSSEIPRLDFDKLRQLNTSCSFFVNVTINHSPQIQPKEKEVGESIRPQDYISVRELLRCSSKDLGAVLLEDQGRSEVSSFEKRKSEDENSPSIVLSSSRRENSVRRGQGDTNPQDDQRLLKRTQDEQKDVDQKIIIEEAITLEAIESPHFAREPVEKTSMHLRNLSQNFDKEKKVKSTPNPSSVNNFLSSKRLAKSKSVNRIGFSLTRGAPATNSASNLEVRNHSAGKTIRHVKSKSSLHTSEISSSLVHDNLCESLQDDSNLLDKSRKVAGNLSRAWGDLYGRKKAERTSQKSCVLTTSNAEDTNPNISIKRNPSTKTLDDVANEKLWIRKFVKGGSVKPSIYSKESQAKGALPATSTSKVFNAAQAKAKDKEKVPPGKDVYYRFNNTKIFSLFKGQIKSLVRPKSVISIEELRLRDISSNGAKSNLNGSLNTNSRKLLH
eukprot:TRINITY_DN5951_c0_g1_i16.p1 TRINITY_DN5951_c0_g1~~TRINITY_DN5951_c0_g1_i16.p1  ORF type:complete len:498 (+),score=94.81 TRINITY_DN5951_c0_g1_i16:179-1672(+)